MHQQTNHHGREAARLLIDYIHRLFVHYALWFDECQRQLGREKAYEYMGQVLDRGLPIQLKRLAKTLNFELDDGLPAPLLEMDADKLDALKKAVAVNWLVNDGLWFQAVEFSRGMNDAKRINDSCWSRFSPFEAGMIKHMLGLGSRPGLAGLKKALGYRLYAAVNKQSVAEEKENSFVFRMDECRVQAARKRKGMDDYPCKSGGLVEYSRFAESIDDRIKTRCIACPPDPHPDEWYCSWEFTLKDTDEL